MTTADLVEAVLAGEPRAVSRAISVVENDDQAGPSLVSRLFAHTGHAHIVGVTGPPGAGKSTLVDRLTVHMRANRQTVGIIAVDPSSPYTGGAVLGDRVRMQQHSGDPGVFVRSMATRGHLGGLARATADAALVMDAAGTDVVIIETVGVGQGEVDIVRTADVSIVTLIPGTGDEVQALKAGIMEIADIFVVNKSDREGADRLVSEVESSLALHTYGKDEWRPPIVQTVATSGRGIRELAAAIEAFRARPSGLSAARRRTRSEYRLREIVSERFLAHLERHVLGDGEFTAVVDRIAARELDPYTAATELLRRALASAARP